MLTEQEKISEVCKDRLQEGLGTVTGDLNVSPRESCLKTSNSSVRDLICILIESLQVVRGKQIVSTSEYSWRLGWVWRDHQG